MFNINAANSFLDDIKNSNATIGIIGQGFVGSAVRAYFDRPMSNNGRFNIVTYDKAKGGSLEDVVGKSNVIFVCVPTPMRKNGECYTGIVESVLDDIGIMAHKIGRSLDSFVVCIKSTVPPGFTTDQRQARPGMRITFSPEFLRETSAVDDMLNGNRVIVGGPNEDTDVVLMYFFAQDSSRILHGECLLVRTESSEAEMVKLFTNGILFTKVMFSNEIYQMCQRLGINYNNVRAVGCIDPRVGLSHTQVPGPDGYLGAGGHCFPKDMRNLQFVAKQLGVAERMFSAVLERNEELREEKDWEKMKERAVTNS